MNIPYGNKNRFGFRRRLFVGLLIVIAAYVGYSSYVGMAFTAGIPNEDMDWNGDGVVGKDEILQSWYAVTVKKTKEGNRECSAFAWRGSGESIRVDCKTTMGDSGKR